MTNETVQSYVSDIAYDPVPYQVWIEAQLEADRNWFSLVPEVFGKDATTWPAGAVVEYLMDNRQVHEAWVTTHNPTWIDTNL